MLLGSQEAVDDEVERAVDNEEEVLDSSEGEHPAGVGGEHAQAPAQVGPLCYAGLNRKYWHWKHKPCLTLWNARYILGTWQTRKVITMESNTLAKVISARVDLKELEESLISSL